jgi:hypothetical protein
MVDWIRIMTGVVDDNFDVNDVISFLHVIFFEDS